MGHLLWPYPPQCGPCSSISSLSSLSSRTFLSPYYVSGDICVEEWSTSPRKFQTMRPSAPSTSAKTHSLMTAAPLSRLLSPLRRSLQSISKATASPARALPSYAQHVCCRLSPPVHLLPLRRLSCTGIGISFPVATAILSNIRWID